MRILNPSVRLVPFEFDDKLMRPKRYAAPMPEPDDALPYAMPTMTEAAEPPYRAPVDPLRYARGDQVRVRFPGASGYPATVTTAYVTGVDRIVTTYVLSLEGCDGCVTVTDHQILTLVRRGGAET